MRGTSGVGGLWEVRSEDVVGKHLAEGGEAGSGIREAVRNDSVGRAKFRLPTPRACVAQTHWPGPLTLAPIRHRAEESEDQNRG